MPINRMLDVSCGVFYEVGYDPGRKTLAVRLKNRSNVLYTFLDVPALKVVEFLNAASMEAYFNDNIVHQHSMFRTA